MNQKNEIHPIEKRGTKKLKNVTRGKMSFYTEFAQSLIRLCQRTVTQERM